MIYTHAAAALIAAALAAAASWQVQAWRYGEQIAELRQVRRCAANLDDLKH